MPRAQSINNTIANETLILYSMSLTKAYTMNMFQRNSNLQNDKNFILDLIAARPETLMEYFYSDLPDHLQSDEDVAKRLLEAG
jgi:hypothetical protein